MFLTILEINQIIINFTIWQFYNFNIIFNGEQAG